MNYYSIPPFLGAIFSFTAGYLILKSNKYSENNISFSIFCFSLFVWLFGYVIAYSVKDIELGLFACRIACTGAMFTAPAFYHFSVSYINKTNEKKFVRYSYLTMLAIVPFSLTSKYFLKGVYEYFWGFYSRAGLLHPLYLVIFFGIFLRGFWLLFLETKKEDVSNLRRLQIKYIFIAYVIALVGAIDYIPKYGLEIYPFGFLFEILFIIITAYAIAKYQLMDIRIAVTRFGIFVFVYSLVLGLPFFVGHLYPDKWILPVSIMAVLATAGPYIYLFLQKRAENKLLEEQKRYQHTLRQAALGMGRIKDLNRLLELMVHILSKTVRMTHCEIFLVDKEGGQYELKASRGIEDIKISNIEIDSPLVRHLKETQMPIVFEEFKHKVIYSDKKDMREVKALFSEMDSVLIVPSFIQDQLLAFITFGEKKSREAYSADDIMIFSILASQAALAIENCIYWEAERTRMKEAGLQQRLVSLDAMASSFAHEVHNPVQGCMLDLELIKDDVGEINSIDEGLKGEILKSVSRVSNNVERISNMILSMLDFSRKSSGDLLPLSIYDVISGFSQLVHPQMKEDNVRFDMEVEDNLPSILGDKVQLEEIFVNFALNSIHAVAKNDKSNRMICFKAFRRNNHLRFEFSDNGYGIKKGMLEDIFLVSVTTKASTEGTGLGLYRVRKIVELHNGKVWAESDGEGKGAKFIIELPIYTGEKLAKDSHASSLF